MIVIGPILYKVKYTLRHHPEGRTFKATSFVVVYSTDLGDVESVVCEEHLGSAVTIKEIIFKGSCFINYKGKGK